MLAWMHPWEDSGMERTKPQAKNKTRDMIYIALLVSLLAVCAWLCIPATIPFTMQTFGVFMALGLLGGRRGAIAIAVYLLLGALGAPVFTGFSGGFGVFLGATGGYLLGFAACALLFWGVTARYGAKPPMLALAMLAGLLVCYAFGTLWFLWVYSRSTGGLMTALGLYVFPFILPDLAKLALALFCIRRIGPRIGLS